MKEWLLSKLGFNYFLMLMFVLFFKRITDASFKGFLLFLFYLLIAGSFGHLMNDFSDREIDKKARKHNVASGFGKNKLLVLLSILGILSFSPVLLLSGLQAAVYVFLLCLQLCLIFLYSAGLFRLKEHYAGVVCDALYSYVLPACVGLVFVWNGVIPEVLPVAVLLLLFLFVVGLRSILNHQLADFNADHDIGVKTFVQRIGYKASFRFQGWLILLEVLLFVAIFALMADKLWLLLLLSSTIYALMNFLVFRRFPEDRMSFLEALNLFYDFYLLIGTGIYLAVIGNYWGFLVLPLLLLKCFYPFRDSFLVIPIRWFHFKWQGFLRRVKS